MKYIDKFDTEPESVTIWKNLANDDWQPRWNTLQNPQKRDLKENLLKEQGFICCYCQKRIELDFKTEIEHIKPRVECIDENEKLEYTNLIASCDGNQRNNDSNLKKSDRHCNNFRKDKPLYINLLDRTCEDLIYYDFIGGIYATDNNLQINETIDNLNLKILATTREKYIEGFLSPDIISTITIEELQILIEFFSNKSNIDNDGVDKYPEYSGVMVNLLKQFSDI